MALGLRDPVLGNAGTLVSFRAGAADADVWEEELLPWFRAQDPVVLPNREVCLRLTIGGRAGLAFSTVS